MNLSNHKLKTIDTDQQHKSTLQQQKLQYKQPNKQFPKHKKQSSRKISLKQSTVKQLKDSSLINDFIVPKHKKSHYDITQSSQNIDHPTNIMNNQKSKLMKQVQHMTSSHKYSDDNRLQPKYSNVNVNNKNKSLIFSQQKLTNPHNYSLLKGGGNAKISSDNKLKSKSREHQVSIHCTTASKKHSTKGSTTKKHSKSVYNYTEFDQCPIIDKKKHSKKQFTLVGTRKSRDSHNRSALTQHQHNPHHQISTSSITKRVNKSKQTLNKLLNNTSIKKTTNNFKVLSNCLKAYIQQQEMSNNKIDVSQIIKMVKAFNKTQIGQVSRPLEELVCEIVGLIQVTVDKEREQSRDVKGFKKDKIKQHEVKFQTPQRLSKQQQQQTFPSSINQHKTSQFNNYRQDSQIILTPSDISKTKKFMTTQNHIDNNNIPQAQQLVHQSSLSKDLIRMQHGLQQLKSQSKQLQKIIRQSSSKKKKQYQQEKEQSDEQQQEQQIEQKKIEIHRLRKILQRQQYLMQKIDNLSQQSGQHYGQEERNFSSGIVREE